MKTENVERMLEQVKLKLEKDIPIDDETIKSFIEDYSEIARVETCYIELPEQFFPYVVVAVVESCIRMGNEGMVQRTELSTNTSYSFKDITDSLKFKLRGMKNPRSFLGYWS